jgi:hypothetical protein
MGADYAGSGDDVEDEAGVGEEEHDHEPQMALVPRTHLQTMFDLENPESPCYAFGAMMPPTERRSRTGPCFYRGYPLAALQMSIPTNFTRHASLAVEYYIRGEWLLARDHILLAKDVYAFSESLDPIMSLMHKFAFVPPPNWSGCHLLE